MSTAYTSAELWTKIRAIDTEIEALRAKPLNYRIGTKVVNRDAQLELLLRNRESLMESLAMAPDASVREIPSVPDYEMTRTGEQLGDELKGSDI